MSEAGQLHRLLREVRKAGSPLARMKVLARAWRTLQRLGPQERAKLAQEVGVDGAEDLVERMTSRHGQIKPAVVLQVLEKARSADPRELRALFLGLRDPRRRGSLLRQGLEAVVAKLEPETPAGDSAAQQQAAQAVRAAARRSVPVSPVVAPAVAAAASTWIDEAAAEPVEESAGEAEPEVEQRAEPADNVSEAASTVRPATRPVPPPPRIPEPPPVGSAPATHVPTPRPSVPAPAPIAPRVVPSPSRPSTAVGSPTPPPSRLRERIAEADGIVRRLRVLRTLATAARETDVDALRQILDLFDAPWARRRALDALLAARAPARLEDALGLVDELESPAGRRWCLGTILDAWDLSERSRQDVEQRRRTSRTAFPGR